MEKSIEMYKDLRNKDLREIILKGKDSIGADMQYSNLSGMDLRETKFGKELETVDYDTGWKDLARMNGETNLSYANLSDSNCQDTDFSFSNLETANLVGAYCVGANFYGANMNDAEVFGMTIDDGEGKEYVLK